MVQIIHSRHVLEKEYNEIMDKLRRINNNPEFQEFRTFLFAKNKIKENHEVQQSRRTIELLKRFDDDHIKYQEFMTAPTLSNRGKELRSLLRNPAINELNLEHFHVKHREDLTTTTYSLNKANQNVRQNQPLLLDSVVDSCTSLIRDAINKNQRSANQPYNIAISATVIVRFQKPSMSNMEITKAFPLSIKTHHIIHRSEIQEVMDSIYQELTTMLAEYQHTESGSIFHSMENIIINITYTEPAAGRKYVPISDTF